jgi:RNA polymerase sigma factor (sigma-70 family)
MASQTTTRSVPELVIAAREGDRRALAELVAHFDGMVRGVAARLTHDREDAADAAQQTWLTVVERIGDVHSPECFAGWLATIARRHALRLVQDRERQMATDPQRLTVDTGSGEPVDVLVERADTALRVRRALARMPRERAQLLVEIVCNERPYAQVAMETGRAIGSLGPTRARYLKQLAREVELQGCAVA